MYEFDVKSTFTLISLMDHLTEVVKLKKSKEPFTPQDVQAYIRRGSLPRYMGDWKIKTQPSRAIGGKKEYKLIKGK